MQVPVIANNRVGEEVFAKSSIKFYGGSFISGQHGQVLAQVRPRSVLVMSVASMLNLGKRHCSVGVGDGTVSCRIVDCSQLEYAAGPTCSGWS